MCFACVILAGLLVWPFAVILGSVREPKRTPPVKLERLPHQHYVRAY